MNDQTYDEGVRDGIRSGNPGLRELSKQINDLGSKWEAAEGRIERARDVLPTEAQAGDSLWATLYIAVCTTRRILEPANAEGTEGERDEA